MTTLHIQFRRDPRLTEGKGNWATCTTQDGRTFIVSASSPRKGLSGGGVRSQGGVVYQILAQLAKAGYEGRPFTAHDGNKVCLRGTIDLKSIPARYGGTKKGKE